MALARKRCRLASARRELNARVMGTNHPESAHKQAHAPRSGRPWSVLTCSLLALPPCDTVDDDDVVLMTPGVPPAEAVAPSTRCLETGGQLTERACCRTAEPFPSTCAQGACDCPPADAKVVPYCECGSVCFDPQFGCVDWF
jgi:hypothetical protein